MVLLAEGKTTTTVKSHFEMCPTPSPKHQDLLAIFEPVSLVPCQQNGSVKDFRLQNKNIWEFTYQPTYTPVHNVPSDMTKIYKVPLPSTRFTIRVGCCKCGQIDVLPSLRWPTVRLMGRLLRTTLCWGNALCPTEKTWLVSRPNNKESFLKPR